MKKRKTINIHILISISSIVLFSLALLACPEISSNKNKHSKKQPKQTTKTPDTPNLQSSPQYTFSDTLSKVLYISAKNKIVPEDAIVDEDTSNAARTIFNALGVKAGNILNFMYVKSTGNDTNDGTTWTTAKQSIETTLGDISDISANNPYLVLIGSGTYTPTKTLNMKNHVAIIGGFDASSDEASGYETDGKTIISGNNTIQVFSNTNLDKSAVLARVTLNAGNATNGGGMHNEKSSPTITHTTFSKNKANWGGGMYNSKSSPTITHTTFSGNTTTFGGGMYNSKSSPMITHTTFSGNIAAWGGGMYNSKSSPTITHTTFSGNIATWGRGMYNLDKSSPTVSSSIFWGNIKNGTPNQIENNNSTPVVAYSIVQGGYTSGTVIITKDPKLQSLANNGGFIETIAIKAGSSAIDKGLYGAHQNNIFFYSKDNKNWFISPTLESHKKAKSLPEDATKYTTDARGYGYKSRPDIGAFEYEATIPSPTP